METALYLYGNSNLELFCISKLVTLKLSIIQQCMSTSWGWLDGR